MWQSFLMVPNQITEETLLQRAWEYQGQKNGGPGTQHGFPKNQAGFLL